MSLGLSTPAYRDWFRAHRETPGEAPELESPLEVPASALSETWLSANVWAGGTGTEVSVRIDGRPAEPAARTQQLQGETKHVGAEFSDPVAAQQQLVHGGSVAEASGHLWRLDLPEDLAPGEHTATVTQTDRYGVSTTERITFTVTS